ncbi:DNA primase, large subunit [Aulographum hederae CBS 113979]|uniref:DNA primase large subunit n=1 Tax=Aulographum hederae CBS 113979 TaxID=1176131 RepID=A0A6G1HG43_9PEZI|nr:DNA primase, large subunit [Aulographum hederae CBS 113979]
MIRQDFGLRVDPKRRSNLSAKQRQWGEPEWQQQDYAHRLNFYTVPPTADISLEEFEEWAIARLKVLSELESCAFRNRSPEETATYMAPILEKHLPLHSNSSRSSTLQGERKKDHFSHFILRLAFSSTEDLRKRYARLETQLFRLRYKDDDTRERQAFIDSCDDLKWEKVGDEEKRELSQELKDATPGGLGPGRRFEDESWFKVDWERVPELVESRRVFLKRGMAYVPSREQSSLVVAEFTRRLDQALELTARAIPRLDEDDRLTPILHHLSQSFTAPDTAYSTADALPGTLQPHAANIDSLSQHFPLCMSHLHKTLRQNSHLKHFGRLQYTLFLKGLGLSLEDCIIFWRKSFRLITDEKFAKEYRYNIRHSYGDVGGDANRRGRGYTPYSCQKLLTEALPGPGQAHGCPYRTFSPDNLIPLLQGMGVQDQSVLKGVREDVGKQRYHIACNRVFEYAHKKEIKRAKDDFGWGIAELDTISHPNTYFKRSFMLKHLGEEVPKGEKMDTD